MSRTVRTPAEVVQALFADAAEARATNRAAFQHLLLESAGTTREKTANSLMEDAELIASRDSRPTQGAIALLKEYSSLLATDTTDRRGMLAFVTRLANLDSKILLDTTANEALSLATLLQHGGQNNTVSRYLRKGVTGAEDYNWKFENEDDAIKPLSSDPTVVAGNAAAAVWASATVADNVAPAVHLHKSGPNHMSDDLADFF
jgi:hypothetical protein